jgi:hypothetical protein
MHLVFGKKACALGRNYNSVAVRGLGSNKRCGHRLRSALLFKHAILSSVRARTSVLRDPFVLPEPFLKAVTESLVHHSLKLCEILPFADVDTEHSLQEMQVLLGHYGCLLNL